MTGAADSLGYSLSAVSQQVRKLEAEVGMPVLDRRPRGVTLTDAGLAIVEHGEVIARQLAALDVRLADIAGLHEGSLRLGTFPTAGASILPVAVTRFTAAHPGVNLNLRSARISGLLAMLQAHDVEQALLWDYEWSPVDDPSLTVEQLMTDPTVLLVSADHRLAGARGATMADLVGERWITRAEHHPVVEVLRRSAHAAGFEPNIAFEAHDYQEAQGMVAVGLGVALVPRLALANLRADVRVVPLGGSTPSRRIFLARAASRVPTPPEIAMRDVLRAVSAEVAQGSRLYGP
ncbi:LysR family transcriptional regulator [Georgenia subflava]|uniref:LysR family transcriptional regulator n=2 Tax=Georgenia subflava TaxID=1622177 RepID=A0A6N7EK64_9MICO|nr:LysR family transcriptional regulator [Georgenia subflava]